MPGMKSVVGMGGTGSAMELAEMLRQMGRGRDTILAHITPEEAQMLMDAGGSGATNPNTGLPEFQDADMQGSENFYGEPTYEQEAGQFEPGGFYGEPLAEQRPVDMTGFRREGGFVPQAEMPGGMRFDVGMPSPTEPVDITSPFRREPMPITPRTALPAVPEEPGFAQRVETGIQDVKNLANKYPNIARLLTTTGQSLPALLNAARMQREGRARAEEFRRLGTPLRQEAENLRQQALAGQLTPQQAREQEAARARARQGAASRGVTTGTQATMIENQLARQRSELGQVNLNNALRQLNLANAYDEQAIRMKLAADRDLGDVLGSIFANIGAQAGRTQQRPPQQEEQMVTRRPELPRQT